MRLAEKSSNGEELKRKEIGVANLFSHVFILMRIEHGWYNQMNTITILWILIKFE